MRPDPSRGFIVGGTSAGGNIAAVLSHLARDHDLVPSLTGIWLSIPPILADDVVPNQFKHKYLSYEELRNAPGAVFDLRALEIMRGML